MIDPWDIAASQSGRSLYVLEGRFQVLRLDLSGKIETSWSLAGDQCAVSVSRSNSVIVTYTDRVDELDSCGTILRSVRLHSDIFLASHAVGINRDTFLVCHGSGRLSTSHLVCLVDGEGRVLQRRSGPSDAVYQPLHVSVADHGCVLVADINNQMVQILSVGNLGQAYDLVDVRRERGWPLRVCYDCTRGNVYVSTLDGKVFVYCVRTRSALRAECLDVHSGLMPDNLAQVQHDRNFELTEISEE